ncbi:lytic murein transglycosylase precursor [Desulforapulum autotrophicum HRM2]|uniref:Lytic murein transglycosylase n=2 Tax=Desulforapulum autotrophicum TaxID=2296 RepID=C0QD79_DESAH|nr:lytic murein transglycosylase precursor [Desulforapulum autotrophicum HRM2]
METPMGIKILVLLVALLLPPVAAADIYMFIDSAGIVHFTNVPTSSDYKLYIRERPEVTNLNNSQLNNSQFHPEIQRAATAFKVDPSLVRAVIKAESDFNPGVVSKKGATGLMQIMPANYDDLKVDDPFDPEQNIMGGTRYLKRLMTRYDGKLPLVLAAYNAGPDAVDRYNSVPPFNETQRYVSKVMKFYASYKR